MNKNFYYRFLLVVTFIVGILFMMAVPELSNQTAYCGLGVIFIILATMTYNSLKDLSEDRINEILGLEFFKSIGCDFSKE